MRAIWSGAISFGLVSIPVRMFTATESKELRFHFLDRRDMSPIGYDKVSKKSGEAVPGDEIIRGFEIEKGQYVEIDVSSVVSQDGTYSFALTPLNSTSLRLSSRETSFGPELVVTG